MKKKNRKTGKAGIITVGGNFALPGQKKPNVIVLTQPKRFGLDISDYMAAVRAAENVDFSRRYKLYDLYEDILMDTPPFLCSRKAKECRVVLQHGIPGGREARR